MKNTCKLALLVIIFYLLQAQAFVFNKIIVFGDSLSSIGKLTQYAMHTGPQSPPYFKGRFSNGPVWVEYLKRMLNAKLEDYAVGGASFLIHSTDKEVPFTISQELELYQLTQLRFDADKDLYIIWAGGNDYLDGYSDFFDVGRTVNKLTNYMQWLINVYGAKYFLIPNLPNLGFVPLSHDGIHKQKNMMIISWVHNKYLDYRLKKMQILNPGVTIITFDVNMLLKDVLDHAKQYGFTNLKRPCYSGGGASEVPLCHGYLFWDKLHPTAKIHEILATRICLTLKKAIPKLDASCFVKAS